LSIESRPRSASSREIPVPLALGHDAAARPANAQRNASLVGERQAFALNGDLGRKSPHRHRAMVVAVVGKQRHAQGQRVFRRLRLRQEPPGRIDGMGARLHPDARLDAVFADLEGPNRGRIIEVKAADANVARRRDGAALPPVREQRPGARPRDHGRIGLGEDQPASERRCDRRDQQSMVAPGQAAGDGAARVAAEAVGDPPFAALCLTEIAADGARESDRRWNRNGSAA